MGGTGGAVKMSDWTGAGIALCPVGKGNATIEAGRYPLFFEPRDNGPSGSGFGQPIFSYLASQNLSAATLAGTPLTPAPVLLNETGFGFTYRAYVTGVSATSVGVNGGALLTISGGGFSQHGDNIVTLGNSSAPCAIVSQTLFEIKCVTAPAAAPTPAMVYSGNYVVGGVYKYKQGQLYPGGGGLMQTVFFREEQQTLAQRDL